MLETCLRKETAQDYAQKVVDKLSDEQLKHYGLTDPDKKAGAAKALEVLVYGYMRNVNTFEEQDKRLNDVEGFISYLENNAMHLSSYGNDLEEAKNEYDKVTEFFKNCGVGERIDSIDFNLDDKDDSESADTIENYLKSHSKVIRYNKTESKDDNGNRIVSLNYIVSEPVEDQNALQKKTISALDAIRNTKSSWKGIEIAKDSDENVLSYTDDVDKIPEGWHRTGRSKYLYEGREIITQSVTGYNPNDDFAVLAAPIGNQVDKVGRMFFDETSKFYEDGKLVNDEKLRDIINNDLGGIFTVQGLKNLISDFQELKKQLQDKWGKDIKVFSGDIRLFGNTKERDSRYNDIWNIGKPDLLVIDNKGIVHVLDFKSYKMANPGKGLYNTVNSSRAEKYSKQVSSYISMLHSYGIAVDQQPYIVQIDTWYYSSDHGVSNENASDNIYYINGNTGTIGILAGKDNNDEAMSLGEYAEKHNFTREDVFISDSAPEQTILYMEPRLHVKFENGKGFSSELAALRGEKNGIKLNENILYKDQWNALDEAEKQQMRSLFGDPVEYETARGVTTLSEDDIESRPDIISSKEIHDVANMCMYYIHNVITAMINDEYEYPQFPLSMHTVNINGQMHSVLYGKSRKEVINLVGLNNLINDAVDCLGTYDEHFPTWEQYNTGDTDYYFDDELDYQHEKKMNEKRGWLLNHKSQLILAGASKLMNLEKCIYYREPKEKTDNALQKDAPTAYTTADYFDIKEDTGDNESNENFIDKYYEGLNDMEAWMLGVRNYSPTASLAQEVRSLFEDLTLVDDNGEVVRDPYGWGFNMNVDSTTAISMVYDALQMCESIEDMQEALQQLATRPGNKWINELLNRLDKDHNLKAKFFRHFRKDRLIYSISEVHFDKETGARVITTRIINNKTAYETMTQSLNAQFFNASLSTININGKDTPLLVVDNEGNTRVNTYVNKEGKEVPITDYVRAETIKWRDRLDYIYKTTKFTNAGNSERTAIVKAYIESTDNKWGSKTIVEGVTGCLNLMGIKVPASVVLEASQEKLKASKTSNIHTFLDNILRATHMMDKYNKEKNGIPRTLKGNKLFRPYGEIIEKLAQYVQEHVEASAYQDGKTYFSYTNPSELGHIIRNLKGVMDSDERREQYFKDNFDRYTGWFKDTKGNEYLCDWVEQLATNSRARKALQHRVELSYLGTQYKDLGSLGFLLSILHNYFGNSNDKVKGDDEYRLFALPTMSNKPTNEFIRMLKYGNDTYNYKSEIINRVLMKTFQQEMNRMADVLYHYTHNSVATSKMDLTDKALKSIIDSSNEQIVSLKHRLENSDISEKERKDIKTAIKEIEKGEINNFQDRINNHSITVDDLVKLGTITSGAKFHFLWYLNDEIANNQEFANKVVSKLNLLLTPENVRNDSDLSELVNTNKLIREVISNNMEKVVNKEIEYFKKIGLFDREEKVINDKTVNVLKFQDEFKGRLGSREFIEKDGPDADYKEMMEAITEFVWQDIAANINIIQITGGDLAYYGDAINYQKRIAQIHSPGLHLMHDPDYDDGYFRSVHISDTKVRDEIYENTKVALEGYLENNKASMKSQDVEDYKKMIKVILKGLTDAMATDGQSYSSYTSYRKKLAMQGEWNSTLEEAYKAVKNGDFNIANLGIMLQPTKPFVTSNMAKYSGSPTMTLRKTPLQDKNSEYMLFLAEALQEGANQHSKLVAISKFMEESAQMHNKQGIDTVHFESVNKVGKAGIIDMNAFDKIYDESMGDYSEALKDYMLKFIARDADNREDLSTDEKNALKEQFDNEKNLVAEHKLYANEALVYNNQYVDTIPVDDYIIQQEVPAHLLEHEQLYGSQIRILGISDITPGTEFIVDGEKMKDTELVDEYKHLHAENIRASYNELMKDLGLIDDKGNIIKITDLPVGTPKRNRALNKLAVVLQREISKDAKYGFDTYRACTLKRDLQGNPIDFTIPLFDPIQSRRIQELLNSYIKKSINKQKINGGPVVQTTAYDEDLHIVFQDKNSNALKTFKEYGKSLEEYRKYLKDNQAGIKYFECYLPVPNAQLERLMTNNNGSMMSIEMLQKVLPKEVWDSMSQIIGYRIPTEDKYSMLPLKIKGFLPKAAGQVIMMPQEITYLTGSDFDIDKMYLMMKSFDTEYYSPKVSYKALIERYKEYLDKSGKLPFKGINAAMKQAISNGNDIMQGRELASWYKGLDTEDKNHRDLVNWYRKQLFQDAFSEYKYNKEQVDKKLISEEDAIKARNNRLLDIQWAVLTNADTTPKMLNPGGFDSMKRIGRMIRIKKEGIINKETGEPWTSEELHKPEIDVDKLDEQLTNTDPHNTTLTSSKLYFQHQNMQGSQMTGLIANNVVSHAFLTFQKIGIDLAKGKNDYRFSIEGHLIGNTENMIILDRQKGFNGQLISKTIATALAAVLDTAKDPVASDLNLNTFTGQVAMLMARMGFDMEVIGYFLSQPILMNLSDLYFKNSTDDSYYGDNAIKEMANKINITTKQLNNTESIRDDRENTCVLTKANLFRNLSKDNYESNHDSPDFEFQKNVLIAFNRLYQMSKDLRQLTYLTKFNSVTNAGGPTIADTMTVEDKVQRFIEKHMEGGTCFYEPVSDNDRDFVSVADVISNDPILSAFYNCTVGPDGASQAIFGGFFPHYWSGFRNIVDTFKDEYMGGKPIDANLYNRLLNDYLYYLLTYSDENFAPTLPSSDEDKRKLVENLVDQYKEVISIQRSRPNVLLDQNLGANRLKIREKDNFIGVDLLVFDNSQLNADNQQEIRDAWTELITMNDPKLTEEDNRKIRDFANNLFFYTLMRNGFTFSPKTLMHLASVLVRYNAAYGKGYNNYVQGIRNLREVDKYLMGNTGCLANRRDFIRQFIRNHSNNQDLVPNISEESTLIDKTNREKNTIVFEVPLKEQYKLSKIMIADNIPHKFISFTTKANNRLYRDIYMLETIAGQDVDTTGNTVRVKYRKTNSLGISNNFIEYNANHDIETSFFDNIRDESEEALDNEQTPESKPNDDDGGKQDDIKSMSDTLRVAIPRILKSSDDFPHGKEAKELKRKLVDAFEKGTLKDELKNAVVSFVESAKKNDTKAQHDIMKQIIDQSSCLFS